MAAAAPGPGSLRQEGGWRRKRPSSQSCSGASTARLSRLALSAPGASPNREEKKAAAAARRRRRGAGGGGAAGCGCRFVVRPGLRKKREEGGARRPAPSAAHGDDARHIRDPPPVAAATPAARAAAPATVVTPPRLAVAAAPPAGPEPRRCRLPAAGDMSNPGGRRNGPVKLRLTGEGGAGGGRPAVGACGLGRGQGRDQRCGGGRAWEGLV